MIQIITHLITFVKFNLFLIKIILNLFLKKIKKISIIETWTILNYAMENILKLQTISEIQNLFYMVFSIKILNTENKLNFANK